MTETVTPVMVVDRMLEILAKPEAWTKGAFARNADGEVVDADSGTACSFCLSGARRRATLGLGISFGAVAFVMREEADARCSAYSIAAFNDWPRTSHADVLDYLKAVRARLEAACPA